MRMFLTRRDADDRVRIDEVDAYPDPARDIDRVVRAMREPTRAERRTRRAVRAAVDRANRGVVETR